MSIGPLDLFAIVLLVTLALVFPIQAVFDFRRMLRWISEGRVDARLRIYYWTLLVQWGVTLGLLTWWLLAGRDLASLGLVFALEGWQWLAAGLGVAALVVQVVYTVVIERDPEQLRSLLEQSADLCELAPQTTLENRLWGLVSITAGICEEILYRGMLMAVLVPSLGTWSAVALTSVLFGLGHAYQGWRGVVKTGLVGLVLALFLVFSGSLWIPILLHITLDLTSGRLIRAASQQHSVNHEEKLN